MFHLGGADVNRDASVDFSSDGEAAVITWDNGDQVILTYISKETDAATVKSTLGFGLNVPENATNVKHFILSEDTEEMHFTLDGLNYTARFKAADSFEDISDLRYDWTYTDDNDKVNGRNANSMRFIGNGLDIDVCLWYDAAPALCTP